MTQDTARFDNTKFQHINRTSTSIEQQKIGINTYTQPINVD